MGAILCYINRHPSRRQSRKLQLAALCAQRVHVKQYFILNIYSTILPKHYEPYVFILYTYHDFNGTTLSLR